MLLHLQTAQVHTVLRDCPQKLCWDLPPCYTAYRCRLANCARFPAARQVRRAAGKWLLVFTCRPCRPLSGVQQQHCWRLYSVLLAATK